MSRVRSLDRWIPAAAALTLLLTAVAVRGADAGLAWRGLAIMLAFPTPFLVAVAWGWPVLRSGLGAGVAATAAAWLLLSLVWHGEAPTWAMVGNVLAGVAGGWTLRRGWRPDAALALMVAALAPVLVWSLVHFPVSEQVDQLTGQMVGTMERNLPDGADEAQRQEALARGREQLEEVAVTVVRIYPAFMTVGMLGQAAIVLGLLRLTARRRGVPLPDLGWPPFTRWRLPFYVVWLLVAGLGLMLTRRAPLDDIGLNLGLIAAAILCVQGLSVQAHAANRLLAPAVRVVFWVVMGLLFFPLLLSSLLLGLVDQWWDIRRLDGAGDGTNGA